MGFTEDYICKTLSNVKISGIRPVMMSMFVKRAHPSRSLFNVKIIQMLERGVNSRILQDYFIATSVQCLKGSSKEVALGSKDLFTSYAILLSGFILSLSIVVVEQLFRKMWKRNRHTNLSNRDDLAKVESNDDGMNFNLYMNKRVSIFKSDTANMELGQF
jgi:hypothetical protein